MIRKLMLFILVLLLGSCISPDKGMVQKYALIIHGGAGKLSLTPETRVEYTAELEKTLNLGLKMLSDGYPAVEVIEKVIARLEDSPLFNAGRGAVFTHTGGIELDAAIMRGENLQAGAVAGLKNIRNPIYVARKVMDKSEHVMLSGKGAFDFAVSEGFDTVSMQYFYTQKRFDSLKEAIRNEGMDPDTIVDFKYGTVGCVALDQNGNLAAGTSTGGMTNKKYGRIGDTPIIGAGTYANNQTCGVSATGHGEFFIRYTVAHDISALMEYKKMDIREASREVVHRKLKNAGGRGGVISLDTKGNYAMEFNTDGMLRAYGNSSGEKIIGILKDNELEVKQSQN